MIHTKIRNVKSLISFIDKKYLPFQVVSSLENKKRGVLDFIAKGEKLMSDPNCPAFLQGHVQKLKEAWEDTNEKAQTRKRALAGSIYINISP